jgi:hypothetical protein
MSRKNRWGAWALLVPLALVPVACGGDEDQRAALEQDELDRELDLALQGDSIAGTFQDTAEAFDTVPEQVAAPVPAAPRAQAPRTPTPRPAPARQESPAPQPAPRPTTATVPSGTTFALRLNEELSTERNQPGDGFSATLTDPILDANGDVAIPAGATVRGRVTKASKSGRVGETAVITVAFEAVSFNGRSYPLQATVIEANPERRNRTPAGEQVAKAAGGAAAGAIIGRVLGKDTRSTVKGAVIGAAAGTAIAMGTADVDAVLPVGSRMVIRLDAPVEVRRAT